MIYQLPNGRTIEISLEQYLKGAHTLKVHSEIKGIHSRRKKILHFEKKTNSDMTTEPRRNK